MHGESYNHLSPSWRDYLIRKVEKQLEDIELELHFLKTKAWTDILPPARKQEKILNLATKKIELEIELKELKA
jgi:hypothetical protein